MPIQRVTHVGICVTDLDRSVRFYRDLLGFRLVSELEIGGEPCDVLLQLKDVELRAKYLERDGLRIELLYFESPPRRNPPLRRAMNDLGFTHVSIRVSDLGTFLDRLRAEGVNVVESSRIDMPAFESGAVMITDPDGVMIELVQAPGDPAVPPGAPA